MNKGIHKQVLNAIAKHGMVRPGDRIGLGVSGGADSVAMLRIFHDLQTHLGIALVALHFHHQMRGIEADQDERFVKKLAAELGLEVESDTADVPGEARRNGWNLEDAARRLRYRFFSRAARERGLNRVAVAHTADDQAETVLSHLLRGTGLAGLGGIYPVNALIIRPLVELRRDSLRQYLSGLGQTWREDLTNQDTSHFRARIRHHLLPRMERDFHAAAVPRLSRLAAHAREDEAFWRALEDERFRALASRESSGTISVNIADLLAPLPFLNLPGPATLGREPLLNRPTLALTRRLVRRVFAELHKSREQLTLKHVDAVLELATKSQSGAKIHLPGVCVERNFDRLRFTQGVEKSSGLLEAATASETVEFSYTIPYQSPLESASIVVTEIHRRFNLKVVDWPPVERETQSRGSALDFDRVEWPLVIRNWRAGDSYRPQGSRQIQKLKRMLGKSRVTREARENWPVLTSAGKVIWAAGYPVDEELAPRRDTRMGIIIVNEEL